MAVISITQIIVYDGLPDVVFVSDLPQGVWPYNGELTFKTRIVEHQQHEYFKLHLPGVPIKRIPKGAE